MDPSIIIIIREIKLIKNKIPHPSHSNDDVVFHINPPPLRFPFP